MQFLDLTLPSPEENLALDEALLVAAEADGSSEFLRLWESPRRSFVVLGKNCRVQEDVWVEHCQADGVAILRRPSGGGTVLIGPGCLNFAVILRYNRAAGLDAVPASFEYVLDRISRALATFDPKVAPSGSSDLAIRNRKFCGNAQRRQRTHFLHHGSILCQFDIDAVARYLKEPQRQPQYRQRRTHELFLTNLTADPSMLREPIRSVWGAHKGRADWPRDVVTALVAQKYGQQNWAFCR